MEASPNQNMVPMKDRAVLSSIDATLKEYWAEQLQHAQRAVEVAQNELKIIEESEMVLRGLKSEAVRLQVSQNGDPTEPSI